MNRAGGFHSFNLQVQQMMEGSTPAAAWWSMHSSNSAMRLHDPPELIFPLLPPPPSSSSASSTATATATATSSPQPNPNPDEIALWAAQDHPHGLPESWCQLLLGGIVGEDQEKYDGLNPASQMKKMESCVDHQRDQLLLYNSNTLKQELYSGGRSSSTGYNDQEIIQVSRPSSWSHQQIPASSPRSCITSSSFSTNMLDFSNKPIHHQPDNNSSECNSTETPAAAPAFKKSRVQGSSSSPKSTLKVRKEKLGDRITALHQLVSPFGKTDTASVLQEAIGYIRFLQGQIEALSSPYLQQQQQQRQQQEGSATASAGNMRRPHDQQQQQQLLFSNGGGIKTSINSITTHVQDMNDEDDDDDRASKRDLRSRGLCLVPVSFTMHVGGDNGADFWAPALGGGF